MTEMNYKQCIALRNRLPWGAQTVIAKKLGLSQSSVSQVLSGQPGIVKHAARERIIAAAMNVKSRPEKPARLDMIRALPWGAQSRIARKLNIDPALVNRVLLNNRKAADKTGRAIMRAVKVEIKACADGN